MAKSAEVSELEKKLDAVLAKLMQEVDGSRSTLRIDDTARGWEVNFVCAEALANAAKHAGATSLAIDLTQSDDRIVAAISDNGVGGADPVRGSGLRGLADRVEAVGGRLRVESAPGAGTRIEAEIPGGVSNLAP